MSKMKVGITGQSGFIGTHLYNTLGLYPDNFDRIAFKDDYFQSEEQLRGFVKNCDVIVHLAAVNRHNEPQVIYNTNISLVKQLVDACENTGSKPHILFSSSTQEERDNIYGRSKKEGREILENWAGRNSAQFTGMIIPNVFGPFGTPYYNSVVATFCHQLTHDETPVVETDSELKLIYVSELVQEIIGRITFNQSIVSNHKIPHTSAINVSALLARLEYYLKQYIKKGVLPNLDDRFECNLFNTFVCYIDYNNFFPFFLKLNEDERGSFVETIKLNSGGQVSFSTTKPGVTRGNHFHSRKAERFAVIKGKARIQLRRIGTDKILSFDLDGAHPSFVDMPIWHTHNITNTGAEDLYTIFWISEHYNPDDPDTYFEVV